MEALAPVWEKLSHVTDLSMEETASAAIADVASKTDPHAVVLLKKPVAWDKRGFAHISREGDVLVGFVLHAEEKQCCAIRVAIANVSIHPLTLEPGRVKYALQDLHIAPLASLQYHEVTVSSETKPAPRVYAIYALLQPDHRRKLAHNEAGMILQFAYSWIKIQYGMCSTETGGQYKGSLYVLRAVGYSL